MNKAEGSEWIVDKEVLMQAAKVLNLVPARPGILSSEFFQIRRQEKGRIHVEIASEIKGEYTIQGKGQWPFEKAFYLDRRVFVPFVLSASDIKSDSPFTFQAAGKSLVIRHGKRKARFDGQPPVKGYGFEENEAKKKVRSRLQLTEHIRYLIRCALNCAASDHTTPQLNCVYVWPRGKGVYIYSTNRTLCYRAITKDKIHPPSPIPFPLFLVELLENDMLHEVQWRDTYVALAFKQGQIWQSVSASARKKFPAASIDFYVKQSQSEAPLFVVPAKRLITIVSRLGMYLTAVRRQDWLLTLSGEKGKKEILLTSTVPQTVFHERLRLDKPLKDDFKVHWPLDQVLSVLQFIGAREKGNMAVRLRKDTSYVSTSDVSLVIPGREK